MRSHRTVVLLGLSCVAGCANYSPPKKGFLNAMLDGWVDGLFDSAADGALGSDDYAFSSDPDDEAKIVQRKGIDPNGERYAELKAEREARENLQEQMK
jgi:hypothetical protein